MVNRPCPKMLHHTSGQAYVAWKLNGLRHHRYLGLWGSTAAWVAYDLFKRSWPEPLTNPPQPKPRPALRFITFGNRTQTLAAWAREVGLKPGTLANRLDVQGWPIERAMNTPARTKAMCPQMQHHEPSGRAFVRWSHRGKRLAKFLGKWGTPEAESAYAEFRRYWTYGKV